MENPPATWGSKSSSYTNKPEKKNYTRETLRKTFIKNYIPFCAGPRGRAV
jgi:hypothetical protein